MSKQTVTPSKRRHTDIHLYCATCGERRTGPDYSRRDKIGERFICINELTPDDPQHHAAIVKGTAGERWLKIENFLLKYGKCFALRYQIKWKGRKLFEDRVGQFLVLMFAVLLFVAYLASLFPGDIRSLEPSMTVLTFFFGFLILIVTFYAILDILLVNTSVAFVSRFPANPLRSVLFALFAYAQMTVSFSVLYLLFKSCFNSTLDFFQAIYFSFVTVTTLGYGDFHPKADAYLVQFFVILQVLLGFYFLLIILSIMVSWVQSHPGSTQYSSLVAPETETSQHEPSTEGDDDKQEEERSN